MNKLNSVISGGNLLDGIYVGEGLCSVISSLNQLEQYGLFRPTRNAYAKTKELEQDDMFREAHDLRETVQRRFDKGRRERAQIYSDYIEAVYTGARLGGVPPITLFCPGVCTWNDERRSLVIPYRSALVNIDGETQTEARFLLRDRLAESGEWAVRAEVYHGITQRHASQILHDFNRYAHPITESVVAALNSEGNLTKLIDRVAIEQNVDITKINRFGIKPNLKKQELATYRGLISAVVGAIGGYEGINRVGAEIGLLNNGKGETMLEAAAPFLAHVYLMLQQHPELRMTEPSLLAIFGAFYHGSAVLVSHEQWATGLAIHRQSFGKGKLAAIEKQKAVIKAIA